jgi:hypothetical protein
MEARCSSMPFRDAYLWKAIWQIKATMVIVFMWKACSIILPTNDNLLKQGFTKDAKCPIYRSEPEIVGHALWPCLIAKGVWIDSVKGIQKCPSDESAFLKVFETLLGRLIVDDVQIIITRKRTNRLQYSVVQVQGRSTRSCTLQKSNSYLN